MPFVFGWLLNGLYLLLLIAVSPILVFRRLTQGKYRHGWGEKLTGLLTRKQPSKQCLWFHAVSVGEVLQLQKVLEETAQRFPLAELFITVTTDTGYDVALTKYPQHTVSYFPLDFSWAVDRALASIRPDLIVLVELELWPNFILTAKRRGIPLLLINGRMGERSFRGYSRVKPLMRRLLSCFEILALQTETYAERLRSLGAPTDRVVVTGNIKFDRVVSDRGNIRTLELRAAFKLAASEQVLIAGSTQDPEERYALEAWQALRAEFPNLRLIIVPRHKERFEEVATMIRQRGCPLIRRSEQIERRAGGVSPLIPGLPAQTISPFPDQIPGALDQTIAQAPDQKARTSLDQNDTLTQSPVAFLDTLGELAACWGLADIAFVGGSLTNRGGQNMIEPAGYGAAVLFGPKTWNFKDITEALLSQKAARVVTGPDDLRETVRDLLRHPETARKLGEAARAFVATQQGATQRTIELIARILSEHGGSGEIILNPISQSLV